MAEPYKASVVDSLSQVLQSFSNYYTIQVGRLLGTWTRQKDYNFLKLMLDNHLDQLAVASQTFSDLDDTS